MNRDMRESKHYEGVFENIFITVLFSGMTTSLSKKGTYAAFKETILHNVTQGK